MNLSSLYGSSDLAITRHRSKESTSRDGSYLSTIHARSDSDGYSTTRIQTKQTCVCDVLSISKASRMKLRYTFARGGYLFNSINVEFDFNQNDKSIQHRETGITRHG